MKSMSQFFDFVKQTKLDLQNCSRRLRIDEWIFPNITKKGFVTSKPNTYIIGFVQYIHYWPFQTVLRTVLTEFTVSLEMKNLRR